VRRDDAGRAGADDQPADGVRVATAVTK
jgi:hypothetical protein